MSPSPATSVNSHDSDDDAQHTTQAEKPSSTKDRECKYCHQRFTSSSLGRHLDQFISKKKPDGIHDVNEIRKLRGGITRRVARGGRKSYPGGNGTGSSATGEQQEDFQHASSNASSTPQNTQPTPAPADPPPSIKIPLSGQDVRFNRMNWQATGVITDPGALQIPGTATTIATPSAASPSVHGAAPGVGRGTATVGAKRNHSVYAADLQPPSLPTPTVTTPGTSAAAAAAAAAASETTRALELSLREVLDAVRAATMRATPPPVPFSFDLMSQTFPGLCLAILPSPAALFQSAPFATPSTIPLSAPSADQHHAVRQKILYLIDEWKWNALSHVQRTTSKSGTLNLAEEAEQLSRSAQTHVNNALTHLDASYSNFISRSVEERQHIWTVELLRAYKTQQDKLQEANDRVERITQEANQLKQQVEFLNRCQWPREMALWPPEQTVFDLKVQKQLRAVNLMSPERSGAGNGYTKPSFDSASNGNGNNDGDGNVQGSKNDTTSDNKWDYDNLVNKWKRHVREDRARRPAPPSTITTNGGNANNISAPGIGATAGTSIYTGNHINNSTGMIPSMYHNTGAGNGNHASPSLVKDLPTHRTSTPPASLRRVLAEPSTSIHSGASNLNSHQSSNNNNNSNNHAVSDYPTIGSSNQGETGITPQTQTGGSVGPTGGEKKMRQMTNNVQIISDVHDHMARFLPWMREQEDQQKEEDADNDDEDEDEDAEGEEENPDDDNDNDGNDDGEHETEDEDEDGEGEEDLDVTMSMTTTMHSKPNPGGSGQQRRKDAVSKNGRERLRT